MVRNDTMTVDEEESSIQKADSPALTEATSYSSSPAPSPQDETDNSSVRRNLFQDPLKDTIDGPNTPANSIDRRPIVLTPNRGDRQPRHRKQQLFPLGI